MSSDKQCCVPGCKESGEMHRVLHSFPNPDRDKLRFNGWLYKIGGPVLSLPNDYIYKYRRVCRAHFETKHLCRNNRLSNIAVPNLNIPGLLSPQRLLIANPMQAICIQPNRSSTLSASRCILHVARLAGGPGVKIRSPLSAVFWRHRM